MVLWFFGRGNVKSEYDAGIGMMWAYHTDEILKVLARIVTNNRFPFGLGFGLGFVFGFISNKMREKIFSIADHNPEFDRGLD